MALWRCVRSVCALLPEQLARAGDLHGGHLCRHALASSRDLRVAIDHVLVLHVYSAQKKQTDFSDLGLCRNLADRAKTLIGGNADRIGNQKCRPRSW